MFALILAFSIFLESSITTLPLTLMSLLIYAVYKKNIEALVLGFIAGIFLDIGSMDLIGKTSIYLVLFLSLVLMYGRKFETESIYYLCLFCFFGTFFFCLIKGIASPIPHAFIATFLLAIIYKTFPRREKETGWQQRLA